MRFQPCVMLAWVNEGKWSCLPEMRGIAVEIWELSWRRWGGTASSARGWTPSAPLTA